MTLRIAMWSGPRNLSTAMMRSFGSRADTFVSDEPFYGCFLKATGADHPMRDAVIAAMDTDRMEAAFKERPALHRFPGNMARRTQALCEAIVRDYGGDAEGVWRDAKDGKELERRLLALPGIGEMKARTIIGILGKQFGVQPTGWEAVAPQHRSLGDVDSAEALAEYQAGKRAHKAQLRAAGMDGERPRPDSKRGPAPG